MPFNDLGTIASWDPVSNTPKLVSGKGQDGLIYRCSAAGTRALDDNSEWNQNDLVAYNGQMEKWFRLGPVNIPTDSEVLAGTNNQKIITSKKLRALISALGFISVMMYGATGDGVTDDTAACQAAIDAAVGKVLLWPAGTYRVTQLTVRSSTEWWGMGFAASVISRLGTAQQDMLVGQSVGWTTFHNLLFRGGDVPVTPAYANVAFNLSTHVTFTNCYFDQFDKLGIGCQGSSNILVDNCYFIKTSMSHQGVNEGFLSGVASGPSTNCTVRNSFFQNCGSIMLGAWATFEFNYCSGWGYGAGVSTSTATGDYYAKIAFNYMASAAGKDSDTFTLKGIENWSAYASIVGNICVGCSGSGIFNGGPYTTITGNSCVNNNTFGEANSGGIVVAYANATNNGRGSTVTGNVCRDTGTGTQYFGVVVSALCDDVTVSGNALRGNVTGPFEIQGGVNPTIIWDGWSKGILDAVEYGVKADGSTDDAPTLNAAIGVVAALGGGQVHLPPGTIAVGSTIDNKYSNVLVKGAGRSGGPVTYAITVGAGTTIKPTFAGTVLKHRSPYGGSNPKNAGGGFVDMNVVENGVATRLLDADSVFFATYRLYLEGTQGTETARFTCGLTGTDLADPCDVQYCDIDLLVNNLYSVPAQAADCVVFTGSYNADVSMNQDFQLVCWHKNGHALRGVTGDNNTGKIIGFRGGGGTGYTVYCHGPTASHAVGFSTNELWVSGSGGAYLEGTGTAGVTAGITNRIWWNDDSNGTPNPVAGTGSYWHFRNTLYDVDHNLVTNRLIGVDVDSHAQTQAAKVTAETARIYNSAGDFIRFDNENTQEWGISVDDTNGNFRILRFTGTGWFNLGNGTGVLLPGPFMRGNAGPVTQTANFSIGDYDHWTINNKAGSSCTVTLPTASSWLGRELMFVNYQAQTLISASSNVVPLGGGAAGTAILAATVGKWATLVSNGTNWVITAAA